ncbi:MAG: hypothetical protein AAB401_22760 [Acidobacteriota bacterium]
MQAIEFQTTVSNGTIEIPDELKGKLVGIVNVRVMPEESQDFADAPNNEPLKTPTREIDWASAERGRRMLERASLNQERIAAGWAAAMREMGIPRMEPVSAEKLQEMMIAEGIDPESNEFSRGIIEMREE